MENLNLNQEEFGQLFHLSAGDSCVWQAVQTMNLTLAPSGIG
jgi:hypothetical protein